jgi:hypothetical protein
MQLPQICVPSACQAAVSDEGWCSSVAKRFISEDSLKLFRGVPVAPGMKQNPTSSIQVKTTTPPFLIAIALAFGYFALSSAPNAFGVVPAPDGGYPGFNTAEGQNALLHLTIGTANTAVGWFSLENVTTASFNTGVGAGTLVLNSGDQNTATGAAALLLNTTGSFNTANGALALLNNTEGNYNTAIGLSALYSNTTGTANTAIGNHTLSSNTTGNFNTAIGDRALDNNLSGNSNTANGTYALQNNTEGYANTAIGFEALSSNETGYYNTAIGRSALSNHSTGTNNIALGYTAGSGVTTASNTIAIGANGENVSYSCYIGQIFGATSASGTPILINSNHKLGTTTSSKRFKEDIKAMDKASETLFSLTPVTFRYKKEIDPAGTTQLGLVAEEVEKVNPDLVVRDKEGKPYSVRYEQVNAMLLNEFLKEHHKVQQQEATIAELKANDAAQLKEIKALAATLKQQASEIQKVSAHVELQKAVPRTVLNNK